MRKVAFSYACFISAFSAMSQMDMTTGNLSTGSIYSVHGKLSTGFVESFKSGSVFFSNDWKKTTVVLYDGQTIKDVWVKLNLLSDEVYYKRNDTTYVADMPVKEIIFSDSEGKETAHFVNGNALQNLKGGWYLKLVDGPAVLYKKPYKLIEESRQYGSATVDRSVATKEEYFLYYKMALHQLKKLQEVPFTLYTKQTDLEKFIQTEKMKKPSEEAYKKLVVYFNSITEK